MGVGVFRMNNIVEIGRGIKRWGLGVDLRGFVDLEFVRDLGESGSCVVIWWLILELLLDWMFFWVGLESLV